MPTAVLSARKLVFVNTSRAVRPSFTILKLNPLAMHALHFANSSSGGGGLAYENAPDPKGPMGKKTLTIISFGGSLWIVRRWK